MQYDSGSRSWTLGHGWNTSALTSVLRSSWTYEVSPFLSSVHVWACYESNFNKRKSAWLSFGLSWLIVSAQFHCAIFAIINISLVLRKKCYMKCSVWNQMISNTALHITFLSYNIPFTGKHEPNELTCYRLCDFVAQLVRVLHWHCRGHGFESRWVTWIFQVHETIA